MIFLESDLAVYKRLTGAPLDRQGRPVLDPVTRQPVNRSRILPPDLGGGRGPSWGIRIPNLAHPHDMSKALTSLGQEGLPLFKGFSNTFRQVPVFDENIEARKWEDVWPCVTFRWSSFSSDQGIYIYNDPYVEENQDAPVESIVNKYGEVIQSGRSGVIVYPHPEPVKVQYTIIVHAKTMMEVSLISSQVLYLFPQKGAIDIEFASGEVHTCDMMFETNLSLDPGNYDLWTALGGEEQRYYKRALIYEIEGYLDNSTNKFGTQDVSYENDLIYQRILELTDMQQSVVQNLELNAEELEPIQ